MMWVAAQPAKLSTAKTQNAGLPVGERPALPGTRSATPPGLLGGHPNIEPAGWLASRNGWDRSAQTEFTPARHVQRRCRAGRLWSARRAPSQLPSRLDFPQQQPSRRRPWARALEQRRSAPRLPVRAKSDRVITSARSACHWSANPFGLTIPFSPLPETRDGAGLSRHHHMTA